MSKEQIKAPDSNEVDSKGLKKGVVNNGESTDKPISVVITKKEDNNTSEKGVANRGTTTKKSSGGSKRATTKKATKVVESTAGKEKSTGVKTIVEENDAVVAETTTGNIAQAAKTTKNTKGGKTAGSKAVKTKGSTVEKSVEKLVESKLDKDNAVDKSEPIVIKVEKSAGAKADKPVEVKADKPVEVKADKPVEVKTDKSVEVKMDKSVEVKVDKSVEAKADKSVETKADKPVEAKADKSVETKADKSVETNVDKPIETKLNKSNVAEKVIEPEIEEFIELPPANDMLKKQNTKTAFNTAGQDLPDISEFELTLEQDDNLKKQAEKAFNTEYNARELISTPEGKMRTIKADRVLDALDLDILASQKAKELESRRIEQYKRREAEILKEVNKEGEQRRAYLEELRRKTREAEEKGRQQRTETTNVELNKDSVESNKGGVVTTAEKPIDAVNNREHTVFDMAYIKYIIAGVVVIALCVIGLIIAACKKSEVEYRDFYNQKLLAKIVSTGDIETGSGFVDSDNDRLSDIEEEKLSTDPYKADTDGDGVIDGVEVYYGFNPLVADNFEDGVEIISTTENCKVSVTGDKDVFDLRLAKIDSASLRGTIGIVSDIYSIADLKGEAHIEIGNVKSTGSKMLAKYNVDKFEPLSCNVTDEVVTANITEPGVYCVIDPNKYAPYSGYDIMFLIDNSGSMYSAEDCKNSDENDIDFQRVDFVAQFINKFEEENTRFGVSTFTRDYYSLYDYTEEKGTILAGLSSIKAPENMPYFNGTDIENALSNVLDKVDNSRRNIIVLITDGMNTDKITTITQDDVIAKCADSNTTIIAVALGNQVDKDALMYYVNSTNGIYARLSNATEFDKAMESLQGYLDQKKHKVEFSKMLDEVEPEDSLELLATANSYFKPEKDTLGIRWLNVDDTDMTRGYALFISQYKAGRLSFDNRINIADVVDTGVLSDYMLYTEDSEPWKSYENIALLNEKYRNKSGLKVMKRPYSDDIYVWSGWASIQNFLHKNKNITEFEYLTIDSATVTDIAFQHVLSNIASFNSAVSKPLVERTQLLNCVLSLREGVPVPAETKYGVGLITKMYQDVEDGTVYALQFYSIKDKDFYNIRLYDYYGDLVYDTTEDFINIIENPSV